MIELIPQTHDSHPVAARLLRAKRAYTTRRVPLAGMSRLLVDAGARPSPGDLILARVERVGKHAHLEGVDGRRSALFVGDEIVVCCAARYAPDQFDAELPVSLAPCHLVAGGGVAGVVRARHAAVGAPTDIVPIGLVADAAGRVANLADHALEPLAMPTARRPITIASLGTSMNAGKTTSAAYLIRGLVRAGLRVGAAKVTGTGSGASGRSASIPGAVVRGAGPGSAMPVCRATGRGPAAPARARPRRRGRPTPRPARVG